VGELVEVGEWGGTGVEDDVRGCHAGGGGNEGDNDVVEVGVLGCVVGL